MNDGVGLQKNVMLERTRTMALDGRKRRDEINDDLNLESYEAEKRYKTGKAQQDDLLGVTTEPQISHIPLKKDV